jgi:exodeoxyribonuclease V beta subunit
MSHRLDPVRFPLRGSRLIEASAGTGKTWTIAALYLRLVLGHGDADTAFARPLLPAEILVMTFTRAATRELSERIRERLREAAAWFRDEEAGAHPTPCSTRCSPPTPTRPRAATPPGAWRWRPRPWTTRRCSPSTPGASACCASTPSTAATPSTRSSPPTRACC